MKTPKVHSRGKRGGVLIATLLLVVALSSIVVIATSNTMSSGNLSRNVNSEARAITAAEYGAELAIAQLTSGLTIDETPGQPLTITGDWVYGRADQDGESLFRLNKEKALDQRRIHGIYDDQEFRVQVRSAKLAYENETMPEGWLRNPALDSVYGEQYAYSDVYEITSTARYRTGEGTATNPLSTAVVRAVVNFDRESNTDKFLNKTGALYNELPQHFQPAGNLNTVYDYETINEGVTVLYADESPTLPTDQAYNLLISGEDHYLVKYALPEISYRDHEPLKLLTKDENYFGALGGYWTNGCLTLNYQVDKDKPANPYRPKTPTFGTSANDRAMMRADDSRDPDTYLLGGKQSKTVTLNENGIINETNTNQANAGGKFDIVMNAFEDLMNLYINMAGITAANSYPNTDAFNDPNQWFRMYIGQYTQSARNAAVDSTSLPLYYGNRIRAQTLHVIKNNDDQTLVREYESKNGTLYDYPASGATWNGNYRWSDATFRNTSGSTGARFTLTSNANRIVVPRVFMWQELVGYSLEKRPGSDHPKLRDPTNNDKRTSIRVDEATGERIPVGFDELFQKNGTSVSMAVTDRSDSIWVRNRKTGVLEEKTSITDFLEEKTFVLEDGTELTRKALAVFIGYEDQRENQSDYNYTDMMFTIYVAPQEEGMTDGGSIIPQTSQQWWEREEEDGLTGQFSHTALTTNADPSTLHSPNQLLDNYNLLGHDPKDEIAEHVYTMASTENSEITIFPRAIFEKDEDNISTGVLDRENPIVKEHLERGIREFYISQGDIMDYIVKYVLTDTEKYYDFEEKVLLYDKALEDIRNLPKNAGINFLDIAFRWDSPNLEKLDLFGSEPSSYQVLEKDIMLRSIAGNIVGYRIQQVPVVKTKDFKRLTNDELGLEGEDQYPEPTMMSLGFLAGEHLQDDTRPAEDGLVHPDPDTSIPTRDDVMTQPDEAGGEPNTYVRAFVYDDPADAVARCYVDYDADNPEVKEELEKLYGMKEKRHSIGFHRSGTADHLAEDFLQDHFEIVLLGQNGFNPYRESESESDATRFIAHEQKIKEEGEEEEEEEEEEEDDENEYAVAFKYMIDGLVPDFEFNEPIDGAGIMVVNGNLIVKDDFAYHGTLIVLGDLVIRPTYKENRLVYGKSGNPIDKFGHTLYPNSDRTVWFYWWEDPYTERKPGEDGVVGEDLIYSSFYLDEFGKEVKDSEGQRIHVQPLRVPEYRGHLTVQGNMLVKGRIVTESVPDAIHGEGMATGKLTVFWSQDAVKEVNAIADRFSDHIMRLTWTQNNDIDVTPIWENTIEPKWVKE